MSQILRRGGSKIKYRKNYTDKITESMQNLGIYSPEYNKSIQILNEILNDLDFARNEFKNSGGEFLIEYTNKNGSKNLVKNPQYQIIADLSDRALRYLNELGLTPAGLKKIKDKKSRGAGAGSKLDEILSGL